MPGGIWTSQNKVRPGAYINFEGEPKTAILIGERGICALTMPLSWGGEGNLITVTAEDLLTGKSLSKVGLNYSDAGALLLRLALANCKTVKIFNSKTSGVRASASIETTGEETALTVTAKYPGTFGNKIAIVITVDNSMATVDTYADGWFADRQIVAADSISSLKANDFVTFSGNGTLATTESTLLTSGTDGNDVANLYTTFFAKLLNEQFNTVAITSTTSTDISAAVSFIQNLRENEGKYVQAVVANASASVADYDGIINIVNGVVLEDGTTVTAAQFTTWVAGATAGAYVTDSLTGKVVSGATSIVGALNNSQIESGLAEGKFILALNQNGTIRVEKDINSYHTFTSTKGYEFSKNKIIRELDEIGSSIKNIWETTYLGKVANNEQGRMLFKSSIIDYLTALQNAGAITEFDPNTVQVERGTNIDAVLASIQVKPVDSMEFLYMTVTIS